MATQVFDACLNMKCNYSSCASMATCIQTTCDGAIGEDCLGKCPIQSRCKGITPSQAACAQNCVSAQVDHCSCDFGEKGNPDLCCPYFSPTCQLHDTTDRGLRGVSATCVGAPANVTQAPSGPKGKDDGCAAPSDAMAFLKCFYRSWGGLIHDIGHKKTSGWSSGGGDGNFVWWCFRRNDRLMFMGILVCAVLMAIMLCASAFVLLRPSQGTKFDTPRHPYATP